MDMCVVMQTTMSHTPNHQHARLLTAIPHSTWAGKKWEVLLLVLVCLVGIIINITVGNIGVSLLFIRQTLYPPTCAPLPGQCLSSEVEYDLWRKGKKEGGVITKGVMGCSGGSRILKRGVRIIRCAKTGKKFCLTTPTFSETMPVN